MAKGDGVQLSNMVQVGWGYYDKRGILRMQVAKPRSEARFPVYANGAHAR